MICLKQMKVVKTESANDCPVMPLAEISDFPDHPYKVLDDEKRVAETWKVLRRAVSFNRIIVREKDSGGYGWYPVTDANTPVSWRELRKFLVAYRI